jgi:hypothetical protein
MYIKYVHDRARLLILYKAYRRIGEIYQGRRKYRVNGGRPVPMLFWIIVSDMALRVTVHYH